MEKLTFDAIMDILSVLGPGNSQFIMNLLNDESLYTVTDEKAFLKILWAETLKNMWKRWQVLFQTNVREDYKSMKNCQSIPARDKLPFEMSISAQVFHEAVNKHFITKQNLKTIPYTELEQWRNFNLRFPLRSMKQKQKKMAYIMVGNPGVGKGHIISQKIRQENPGIYIHIDPDHMFDLLAKQQVQKFQTMRTDVQNQKVSHEKLKGILAQNSILNKNLNMNRDYINLVTHTNFMLALQSGSDIIFDGTGKDPVNQCGRVMKRLKEHDYQIHVMVVMSTFNTAIDNIKKRAQQTGRDVPRHIVQGAIDDIRNNDVIRKMMNSDMVDEMTLYNNENHKNLIEKKLTIGKAPEENEVVLNDLFQNTDFQNVLGLYCKKKE